MDIWEKISKRPCGLAVSFWYNLACKTERSHSWPSALAWRASIPKGIVGSNPTLSADLFKLGFPKTPQNQAN